MAFSYWESNEWLEGIDLCIIGGGIVGLSSALFARELHPDWKITVIDEDPIGHGGSSKNAGFTCFGSYSELKEDRKLLGNQAALELVQSRINGLRLLLSTFEHEDIGYNASGSFEFFPSGSREPLPNAREIQEMNQWIHQATGFPDTFQLVDAEPIPEYRSHPGEQALFSKLEGTLDTGKLNRRFREKVQQNRIDLINGCRIDTLEKFGNDWRIKIISSKAEKWTHIPHVIVATNAFGKELIPHVDVIPIPNLVLVTEPITSWVFNHAVHIDAGYVYIRNIGNRMLIGGGRHWNLDQSQTRNQLIKWLHEMFPRTQEVQIEYEWTGILGIGNERSTIVESFGKNGIAALRMGGMGIAIGMNVAKQAIQELEHQMHGD
ncbi:MAG: FAD-dependent oxidoreductase [Bacteroidetes bacterium]|nr:FAD-dependent oxidoreductase [Bacteroidota bacterium]MDA1335706.1 FAD-dependent oxidoreductase [Bacteroidota bacterium]